MKFVHFGTTLKRKRDKFGHFPWFQSRPNFGFFSLKSDLNFKEQNFDFLLCTFTGLKRLFIDHFKNKIT